MRILIVITMLYLMGCDSVMEPKMKCEGGVLYVRSNGAWIQAKLYETNKCLPMEPSKE